MEQYLINTGKKSCTVNFQISTAGSAIPIYIVGFDILSANTLYFRSRFKITGEEEVNLNCPQSPIMLKILVWAENDLPYKLNSITVTPLAVTDPNDPIVNFIQKFSRIAGRVRPGNFVADGVPFTIQYKKDIYTDNGDVHPTPARISIELPVIQVSKSKFDEMTIPERIIILLHEVSHNYINNNQDSEIESDQHALDIYNQLGYPKIEAVNAFGDIMSDTDNNYQRMVNLVNM